MRKYKISENASGRFALEVAAEGDSELWVAASRWTFRSRAEAEEGIVRLVNAQRWYYDETGKPCR